MILLLGCNGSMGRRYAAIMKHSAIKFKGIDFEEYHAMSDFSEYDSFIVAVPTGLHIEVLEKLIPYGKPILCEKPIATTSKEVIDILEKAKQFGTKIQMVLQYDYIKIRGHDEKFGWSGYNYYNHGKDGLAWDCLQIIGLAHDSTQLEVQETSPYWLAYLNGHKLSLSDMDQAYVDMLRDWISIPKRYSDEFIILMHERVEAYQLKMDQSK